MGARRWPDLTIVVILTIAGVVLAILDLPVPLVRALIGIPLALVLPGYALLAAAFARSGLQPIEWALGSVAGSVIVAVVGGFVLNWTPWGIRPQTFAAWIGAVTLLAVIVAAHRRGETAPGVPRRIGLTLSPGHALLIGLAALVFIAAVGIALYGANAQPRPGFTQLWLLPAANGSVRVGVHNVEAAPLAYILRIQADGMPMTTWTNINLQPGETWEMTLSLTSQQQQAATIEALLYRANADGIVYRRATLER